MKKAALLLLGVSAFLYSCHKTNDASAPVDFKTMEGKVLSDFVNVVALPEFQDFQVKAVLLHNAVVQLDSITTNENLATAQASWKNATQSWEQSKAIYFGPILDRKYAAELDTWPTSAYKINAALANNPNINLTNVDSGYGNDMRGFHALEFLLWGKQGRSVTDSFTAPKKAYMASLSRDIQNLSDSVYKSWTPISGNFQQQVLMAGMANSMYTRFANRQAVFMVIVNALSQMTAQVNSNMYVPFHLQDSGYCQSRYAYNSISDHVNNITGISNIYYCSYNNQNGTSLSSLIASKDPALDNKIRQQISQIFNAFNVIGGPYEIAIYQKPSQIQDCLNKLTALQSTLDNELVPFVTTYVKD